MRHATFEYRFVDAYPGLPQRPSRLRRFWLRLRCAPTLVYLPRNMDPDYRAEWAE